MKPRLLCRLSGRPDGIVADLARLLTVRQGDVPARPDLGLPVLPNWLPDDESRRRLQQAIAQTVRAGEPRLATVIVQLTGSDQRQIFTIRASCQDGGEVGASAQRTQGGALEVTA